MPPKLHMVWTASQLAGGEDRVDNTIETLCLHLLQFLSHALQDVWICHATEQAESSSSGHATERAKSLTDIAEECDDMVFATIEEWPR